MLNVLFRISAQCYSLVQQGLTFMSVARQWRHSTVSSLAASMHDAHQLGADQQDVALAVGANLVSLDGVQTMCIHMNATVT